MDGITAAVTVSQATAYCSTLISSLIDLYKYLKHGHEILKEYCNRIFQLQSIVSFINESSNVPLSRGLGSILDSIHVIIRRLLRVVKSTSPLRDGITLLARKKTIEAAFAALERQKSTLLLHLIVSTQNMPRALSPETGEPEHGKLHKREKQGTNRKRKAGKHSKHTTRAHPAPNSNTTTDRGLTESTASLVRISGSGNNQVATKSKLTSAIDDGRAVVDSPLQESADPQDEESREQPNDVQLNSTSKSGSTKAEMGYGNIMEQGAKIIISKDSLTPLSGRVNVGSQNKLGSQAYILIGADTMPDISNLKL